jgi:hypothetical protein
MGTMCDRRRGGFLRLVRTAQDYDVHGYGLGPSTEPDVAAGWVVFAAVMLALAGVWNVIVGVLAITSSHVYAAGVQHVFGNLETWGWIIVLLGILQGLAALALLGGSALARWFGIVAAGANAIGQLLFLPAYPWWSFAAFAVDVTAIYALSVYGGASRRVL